MPEPARPPQPVHAHALTLTRRPRELVASAIAAGACTAVAIVGALAMYGGVHLSMWLTPRPLMPWHDRLAQLTALPMIDMTAAVRGREIFEQTCSLCHGSNGLGKPGLGKSLVHSDFLADRDEAAMIAFLHQGRPANDPLNTTRVTMPPKGGNDALTDVDLAAVVTYVRGLQDPRRMPALPTWVPPVIVATQADKDAAMAAAGGDAELAGYIAHGTKLFNTICIACHGPGGVGIQGNGKALVKNEFIHSQDDDALLAFVKHGRDPGDPKNTTGVGMPPKGGNPALTDDDLLDVISYLRTLQAASVTPPK